MIPIAPNDYWNGWVGFNAENSTNVNANEDSGTPILLTIERKNATFGALDVYWRAVVEKDSLATRNDRIDLIDQLATTMGKVSCPAKQSYCHLSIGIINDAVSGLLVSVAACPRTNCLIIIINILHCRFLRMPHGS